MVQPNDFAKWEFKQFWVIASLQTVENGLLVQSSNGSAEIIVYRSSVIRIHIRRKNDDSEKFSYAVNIVPETTDFELLENDEKIVLKTDLVQLKI